MPIPRLPQNDREFTYQVGWKKGTIHKKMDIETPAIETPAIEPLVIVPEDKSATAYIWFKAPMLPASFDLYLLYLLPIVSILAISALIYLLKHF
jgi:hypothetical protein